LITGLSQKFLVQSISAIMPGINLK